MGSFSNGTEIEQYESDYCSKCIHGKTPCTIIGAHMLFNGREAGGVLSLFIKYIKKKGNAKCTMFIDKKKDKDHVPEEQQSFLDNQPDAHAWWKNKQEKDAKTT